LKTSIAPYWNFRKNSGIIKGFRVNDKPQTAVTGQAFAGARLKFMAPSGLVTKT